MQRNRALLTFALTMHACFLFLQFGVRVLVQKCGVSGVYVLPATPKMDDFFE